MLEDRQKQQIRKVKWNTPLKSVNFFDGVPNLKYCKKDPI